MTLISLIDDITSNDTDVTKHFWQNPDHYIDFNNPVVLSYASNCRKLLIKRNFTYTRKATPTHH